MIGGSKVYEQAFGDCRFIYETLINEDIKCDTFLPEHKFKCRFVSKTMKENDLTYDYRIYSNPNKYANE